MVIRRSNFVLVLTGSISRTFEGFSSVMYTTVATKLKKSYTFVTA